MSNYSSRYENIDCPICKQRLSANAQVVVCPECGAPYHLDCYRTHGSCIFDDLHASGESWKAPDVEKPLKDERTIDGKASLRCSRCGTANPATGIFCQVCGNELAENENQGQQVNSATPPVPPMGIPFNPFTTPFGGVDPNEDIDGISAKEMTAFVGKNSHYYIPRFNQLSKSKGRAKIINWAGFFFTGWYYIYRKMYGIGVAAVIIDFILGIPYLIMMYTQLGNVSSLAGGGMDMNFITTLNMVSNLCLLFFRFSCGFYANSFYKRFATKRIAKIRDEANGQGEEIYMATLGKKGSVAIKLISSFLIGYVVIYFLSLVILMLNM